MPGSGGGREPREPVCPRSCIGVKLRAASGPAICIPRNLGQPRTVQSHTTHTAQTTSTVRRWSYHGAAHTHTAGRGRALPPGRRLRRMGRLALCVGRQRGRRARLAPLARRRARDVGGDVAFSSSRAVRPRRRHGGSGVEARRQHLAAVRATAAVAAADGMGWRGGSARDVGGDAVVRRRRGRTVRVGHLRPYAIRATALYTQGATLCANHGG
jgi:hypothetical protein